MSETRKDIVSSLIFFLLGVGVLISASFIKDPGLSEMGPSKFPEFIGTCMIVLSGTLFAKTILVYQKQKQAGSCEGTAGANEGTYGNVKDELRALAIAGICLLYAVTFTSLGYFVSTFMAITLICLLLGEKRVRVYLLLYVVSVIIWMGFTYLLAIRLP